MCKKVFLVIILAITICGGWLWSYGGAQAQGGLLQELIPSTDSLMGTIDQFARDFLGRGTAFGKVIYPASGAGWGVGINTASSVKSPFVANTNFREGLVRPLVSSFRDSITNPNANYSDDATTDFFNEAIYGLKQECMSLCSTPAWYGKYQKYEQESCDKDGNCTCGGTPRGNGDPSCPAYSAGEMISLCRQFECSTTEECETTGDGGTSCTVVPYSDAVLSNTFFLDYSWVQNAASCLEANADFSGVQRPVWCNYPQTNPSSYNPSNPNSSNDSCTRGDMEIACLHKAGALPKLAAETINVATYFSRLMDNIDLSGGEFDVGIYGDWLVNRYRAQFDLITQEMQDQLPQFVGGGYDFSRTPSTMGDPTWSQPGYCNNHSATSCSCADILPVNGKELTHEMMQRKLGAWGVSSPGRYCVNSAAIPEEQACASGYAWDPHRTDLGKRNLYAARAAFPGYVDDKGVFHAGGLCGQGGKGKSVGGGSGSKERTYTTKDFWVYQTRWFEDNYRPTVKGNYGGCDDRSDILYSHNTAAQCERKKSSSPKCRSGSRTYSSWACDDSGGVVNQCAKGFSAGRNTSCQVCGPLYCGSQGMFSDTDTVVRNWSLVDQNLNCGGSDDAKYGPYARHYKMMAAYAPGWWNAGSPTPSYLPAVQDQTTGEILTSYRSVACIYGGGSLPGGAVNNCTGFGANDALFGENILPDRTCAPGSIVDPCSEVSRDSSNLANNWGGQRFCYKECCVDGNGNRVCDKYESLGGIQAGVCPECLNPVDACSNTSFSDALGFNGSGNEYAHQVCGYDNVRGYLNGNVIDPNQASPTQICSSLGAGETSLYPPAYDSTNVGKAYTYPVANNQQCYLCGCQSIAGTVGTPGKSGWWPANIRFAAGASCPTDGVGVLTPLEKCAQVYQPIVAGGASGFDGLAYANDGRRRLLRSYADLEKVDCVRCRCVAGDGICDGCSGDPNGACGNYEVDPDCPPNPTTGEPECPVVCTPDQCVDGATCPEYDCPVGESWKATGKNHQDCGMCVPDGICTGNNKCDTGETCANCPAECGECPDSDGCPEGFSEMCEGPGYCTYADVNCSPGYLASCKRCLHSDDPDDPDHDKPGGCEPDGYCNPLCYIKDEDCHPWTEWPEEGGCPIGYKSGEACFGGAEHPMFNGCYACNGETCNSQTGVAQCDFPDTDATGIKWEPLMKADQVELYQLSHCYGYQRYETEEWNTLLGKNTPTYKYDWTQAAAWMYKSDNSSYSDSGSIAGYRRCRPPRIPSNMVSTGGVSGDCEYVCVPQDHRLMALSCSEIDVRYPHEFGTDEPTNGGTYVFIPDISRSAGNSDTLIRPTIDPGAILDYSADRRCGRYYRAYGYGPGESANGKNDINGDGVIDDKDNDVNGDGEVNWKDDDAKTSYLYTDWWQAGGSAYGQGGIGNYGDDDSRISNPGAGSHNPVTGGYVHDSYQYALTNGYCPQPSVTDSHTGSWSPDPADYASLASGVQVTGEDNRVTSLEGYRTYRNQDNTNGANDLTATGGYTYLAQQSRALDWQYYITKFNYGGISSGDTVGDAIVYKIGNGLNDSVSFLNRINLTGPINNKRVYFIDGNLELDYTGSAPYTLGSAGYLAFVVRGNLIVNPSVGEYITGVDGQGCNLNVGALCNPSLDAVVIAAGLEIEVAHSNQGVDSLFNYGRLHCDRRLLLKGAYSFWDSAKDVVFTRSLVGCGFKIGSWPNGTDTLNTHQNIDGPYDTKNQNDQYCRTNGGGIQQPVQNFNGYWDYSPYGESGMYNNYNRVFSGTQIISNPTLINNTPLWMRESSSTRLEVQ